MSARTPRRTFSRPFVVTLVAAPACYTSSQAPPPEPQAAPPPPPIVANPPRPEPENHPPVIANPPPPTDDPPASPPPTQQAPTSWVVHKTTTGCVAQVKVDCPKPMPCNPPGPIKYTCPDNVSLDHPITIVTMGDHCIVQREMPHCPPHAMCNPPPPQAVPCPGR